MTETNINDFIHLHTHSDHSLSDSILRVDDLVAFAKSEHAPAIALTDRNNMYGMIPFYKKARAAGIKPILGCDLTVRDESGQCHQLILLAQNHTGLIHLYELISFAYLHDQDSTGIAVNIERFTKEQCDGIIALSGGLEGDIGHAIFANNPVLARKKAAFWQDIFGDRYYLQIACHGKKEEYAYIAACQEIGMALNIASVATNLACFGQQDDFYLHEIRVCIAEGVHLDDPNRTHFFNPNYTLTTRAEMAEIFAAAPQLLHNSSIIARRCNVTLTLGKNYLPDFPLPAGTDVETFLRSESINGLEARLQKAFPDPEERQRVRPEYEARLNMELQTIIGMGFSGYFLIVADFIQWAKEQDIPVGPGRGSGAGSLVAFALQITDIDPIKYDLIFERFLNPERVSMPDFDVDFCGDRRDEVIDYVSKKYGSERVSQISTIGTMGAKAVIRDVGRVKGMPYGQTDRIAKTIPNIPGIKLPEALYEEKAAKKDDDATRFSPELKALYDKDPEVRELIDDALKLEGLARNVSRHAGGVVIAPTKLSDFSPLYCEEVGAPAVTQFDKDHIEAVGLVKFDFLALRNLTVIKWALGHINQRRARAQQPPLDLNAIPYDDPATFALLHSTKTTAVFQLEGGGIKSTLGKLHPDNMEEIIALLALYRPGPLGAGMVDTFIDCKHGRKEPEYLHPDLKEPLQATYGIMVYQEQIMKVAQILANYSFGEADNLRRAMGKKKPEEMARNHDIFISRAKQRGVSEELASKIFSQIEYFAGYGFNKSHSAAYAILAYQTAWLKAHYPAELMAAVLTSEMDKIEKIVHFIFETRDMGLTIIPPCVNRSQYDFIVDDNGAIVYGLGAIKGVGASAVQMLIAEREKNGAFTSLIDLCQRLNLKKLNKKTLETLICSGSFDFLGENRGALLAALPTAIQLAEKHHQNANSGQGDLFGLFGDEHAPLAPPVLQLDPADNWTHNDILRHERDALGLFLISHPISEIADELRQLSGGRNIAEILEDLEDRKSRRNESVPMTITGVVTASKFLKAKKKKNNEPAGEKGKKDVFFFTLDDRSSRIELRLAEEKIAQFAELCQQDRVLIVHCQAEYLFYRKEWRFKVENVIDFAQARFQYLDHLRIDCPPTLNPSAFATLNGILTPAPPAQKGVALTLTITAPEAQSKGHLLLPQRYLLDNATWQELVTLFGAENLIPHYFAPHLVA